MLAAKLSRAGEREIVPRCFSEMDAHQRGMIVSDAASLALRPVGDLAVFSVLKRSSYTRSVQQGLVCGDAQCAEAQCAQPVSFREVS